MKKRHLVQLAVSTFVLAANMPNFVAADDPAKDSDGIMLTAKCGGHGCGAASRKGEISDNTSPNQDSYNPYTNSYQSSGSSHQEDSTSSRYSNDAMNDWSSSRSSGRSAETYGDSSSSSSGAMGASSISDDDFRRQLNPQTRSIFDNLSWSQKDQAKQLSATNPSFKDKNAAVREVQRKAERENSSMNR